MTRCPHGIQARCFSSVRHTRHGFAGDESFLRSVLPALVEAALISFFTAFTTAAFGAFVPDSADSSRVDISTSILDEALAVIKLDSGSSRAANTENSV